MKFAGALTTVFVDSKIFAEDRLRMILNREN